MIKSPTRRLLLVGVASLGFLAACGGSDDDSFDDRADVADPKVRFVNAVPNGPNLTLLRGGVAEANATDVAYKSASQYYDVATEDYTFSLRTAPGNVELDTDFFNAERGNKYTLVALPTGTGAELLTVRDPYNKSVTSNDSRLRVLNAAENASSVDVYLTAVGADIAAATPTLFDIAFKEVQPESGDDSVEVEQGNYRLRLTQAGSKTVIFNAPVTVPEDGDWLLVVLPEDAATPNSVRVLLVRADDSDDATDEIVTE